MFWMFFLLITIDKFEASGTFLIGLYIYFTSHRSYVIWYPNFDTPDVWFQIFFSGSIFLVDIITFTVSKEKLRYTYLIETLLKTFKLFFKKNKFIYYMCRDLCKNTLYLTCKLTAHQVCHVKIKNTAKAF